jgi:hypothetical protein
MGWITEVASAFGDNPLVMALVVLGGVVLGGIITYVNGRARVAAERHKLRDTTEELEQVKAQANSTALSSRERHEREVRSVQDVVCAAEDYYEAMQGLHLIGEIRLPHFPGAGGPPRLHPVGLDIRTRAVLRATGAQKAFHRIQQHNRASIPTDLFAALDEFDVRCGRELKVTSVAVSREEDRGPGDAVVNMLAVVNAMNAVRSLQREHLQR